MTLIKEIKELINQILSVPLKNLPEKERPVLLGLMTRANLARLRVAAFTLAFLMSMVIVLDLAYYHQPFHPPNALAFFPDMDHYINLLRFIVVAASVVFLALSEKRCSAEQLSGGCHLCILGYLFFLLLSFAFINAVRQVIELSIPSTYIMGVIISSAFIYMTTGEFLVIYTVSGTVMCILLLIFQDSWFLATARCINVGVTTLIGFLLSRINMINRVQEFTSQMLIEKQKEELARTSSVLLHLSYLDPLLSIPNRRYFDEILHQEWEKAAADKSPIALLLIDIDGFKLYNDNLGHQLGDDCLKKVANTLNAYLRNDGYILSRFGGDELVAILPNADLEKSCGCAEGLRQAVSSLNIEHPFWPSGTLTVSIGLACRLPGPGEDPSDLITAADEALYQAKENGRDQVFGAG